MYKRRNALVTGFVVLLREKVKSE